MLANSMQPKVYFDVRFIKIRLRCFGFGLLFLIARTENISYVSMRFWWVVWLLCALLFIVFQVRQYGSKYYKVLPKKKVKNKNARYLPKQKK